MNNEQDRPYRIALVEDSDEDVYLIQQASLKARFSIQFVRFATAESAISGMTTPDFDPPDGIVVDLNLPGRSGLDVINAVRRSERLRRSPIVVMTSSVSARDRSAAQALDIWDYVAKPTGLDDFEEVVVQVLDKMLTAHSCRP